MSHLQFLEAELEKFDVELSSAQKLALALYCDELVRWNQKVNLTSLSGAALVRRLVAEPSWIARQLSLGGSLVDIGSGNGSPAIPFFVIGSLRDVHLVEARAKRAAFLRHVTGRMNLSNVEVHRARFEEIASSLAVPDWISLQAVALNEKLLDSIRLAVSSTTTVLWITSAEAQPGVRPTRTLTVPITGTQVFLFNLDLS